MRNLPKRDELLFHTRARVAKVLHDRVGLQHALVQLAAGGRAHVDEVEQQDLGGLGLAGKVADAGRRRRRRVGVGRGRWEWEVMDVGRCASDGGGGGRWRQMAVGREVMGEAEMARAKQWRGSCASTGFILTSIGGCRSPQPTSERKARRHRDQNRATPLS